MLRVKTDRDTRQETDGGESQHTCKHKDLLTVSLLQMINCEDGWMYSNAHKLFFGP